MPILYYADSIYKKWKPTSDVLQASASPPLTQAGRESLNSAISMRTWLPVPSWNVQEILLHISSSSNKDYAVGKLIGRGIIKGVNDSLWITRNNLPRSVVIPQGFYTGTELCVAFQTAANAVFADLGFSFTTVYNPTSGLFTITPTTGLIGYMHDNPNAPLRHSTAETVFGLMNNQAEAAQIVSDTVVPTLGTKFEIVGAKASSTTYVVVTDELAMDVDMALYIDVSTLANQTVDWRTVCQEVLT